jgi:NADPH-dependent curcumin reductase CurA
MFIKPLCTSADLHCGLVAHYNGYADVSRDRLSNTTMLAVLRRSLLLRGFINSEFILEH